MQDALFHITSSFHLLLRKIFIVYSGKRQKSIQKGTNVRIYFSGQKPHCIRPGTSFEKQQVVRTVVFNKDEGLQPFKYLANWECEAIPVQSSSSFSNARSCSASGAVSASVRSTWYCQSQKPKIFSQSVSGETEETLRI